MKKLWKLSPPNKELQESLSRELDVLPVTAQLLINRGLVDCGKAFSFLSPDLRSLYDPFLMKDMDRAVKRIVAALQKKEKIAIYGDYDVDGVSASALLYLFFREIGVDVLTCIPDRKAEGYGLNVEAIKRLASSASGGGAKLIITVDCGTSNHSEILFASSIGIDCIVTDHHLPPDGIPPAYAIVNPMRKDCLFPFKGLSGAGVAFNLLMALRAELKKDTSFLSPNLKKYLDLVCIGTIADMVPLTDENRILVSWGLKELSFSARPGIVALKEVSGINTMDITAENIAFQFAPRINAAGRLAHADTALRLLITEDRDEARLLAKKLNSENISRQGVEARILTEALELAPPEADGGTDRALVLASDNWHAGVVGIVAGRLAERFAKPVALIAMDGDTGRGSVRGVKGCNVFEGLKSAAHLLERYGGHRAAAGLTVRRDKLDDFRAAFIAYMNSNLSDEDLIPEVELDCMVSFDELNLRLLGELKRLEPFGQANEKPLFCAIGADILNTEVVKEKHLRIKMRQNGTVQSAMAFRMAGLHPIKGNNFDVAFYPYVDEWRGVQSVRLNVKDIKPSAQ
ncbi:MAG TPA: single-stranded-DNA-specific exonuclease RecJ [Thermodesulfobacteriota bacterium]|nr:single-stranded-DNA-specific exonuclease RecJ [Thermodesulfobacteriota bacterium]